MKYQEYIIWELSYITKLSHYEIVEFVQSNVISYSQLKEWYLTTCKMPNVETCNMIYRYGIDTTLDLWKRSQSKIGIQSVIGALNKLGY